MTTSQKRKGDSAEREAAEVLAAELGRPVRRKLGAGRSDDTGDLDGVPEHVVEVKYYPRTGLGQAVLDGVADAERERAHSGLPSAVAMVRKRGGGWIVAMSLDQWVRYLEEGGYLQEGGA